LVRLHSMRPACDRRLRAWRTLSGCRPILVDNSGVMICQSRVMCGMTRSGAVILSRDLPLPPMSIGVVVGKRPAPGCSDRSIRAIACAGVLPMAICCARRAAYAGGFLGGSGGMTRVAVMVRNWVIGVGFTLSPPALVLWLGREGLRSFGLGPEGRGVCGCGSG